LSLDAIEKLYDLVHDVVIDLSKCGSRDRQVPTSMIALSESFKRRPIQPVDKVFTRIA
jgi:hypothetical protein